MAQDSSSKPAEKPKAEKADVDQSGGRKVKLTEKQKKLSEAPGRAQIKPPPLKKSENEKDEPGVIRIDPKGGKEALQEEAADPTAPPELNVEAEGPYSPANQNLPNTSGLMRDLRKRPPSPWWRRRLKIKGLPYY